MNSIGPSYEPSGCSLPKLSGVEPDASIGRRWRSSWYRANQSGASEVTSERIRDKISASKRKGLWVGGMVQLGYDTKGRKITVNEAEAERVRTIFRSYLKLGSLNLLMVELRKQPLTRAETSLLCLTSHF